MAAAFRPRLSAASESGSAAVRTPYQRIFTNATTASTAAINIIAHSPSVGIPSAAGAEPTLSVAVVAAVFEPVR